MKKVTIHKKYRGYAKFNEKRSGVFVFPMESKKNIKIARVYKQKDTGEMKVQRHAHGATEARLRASYDWIPLPPEFIPDLIEILKQTYLDLQGQELPESEDVGMPTDFEKVKEDKDLDKEIKGIL